MSDPTEPCLNCPDCGHPQEMSIGPTQAFCVNVHCRVLTWDPSLTLAENLAASGTVELPTVLAGAEKQP